MTDQGKRDFTRSQVDVEALITFEGRGLLTNRIASISLNGMYLSCQTPPQHGTSCDIVLYVGGRNGARIEALGTVARTDDQGVGIAFQQIHGTESLHHLRQLVLLNSSNPSTTEHEYDEHVGLKRPPEPNEAEE